MIRLRWSKGDGPWKPLSLSGVSVRMFVEIRLRYGSGSTESHVPRGLRPSRRELTPVLCSVRLSWRRRARPSTTLHEIRPAVARGILNTYHRRQEFATCFPQLGIDPPSASVASGRSSILTKRHAHSQRSCARSRINGGSPPCAGG